MITTGILSLIYGILFILTYPIRALSDVTLDSGLGSAISGAGEYLAMINQVLPVTTLLTVFGLLLTIEGIIFTYKIIMWGIRRIPGQG